MAAVRVVLLSLLLALSLVSSSQSLPRSQENTNATKAENPSLGRDKRAVGVLTVLGLAVSLASTIQGGICTFSTICGSDPLPTMLDDLQERVDDIESGLSSLQTSVADIWQESKRSWYFDQIEYVSHLRNEVLEIIEPSNQQDLLQELQLQRFIDEALGENGKDKNVLEALYNIPRLVTEERLVEHYLRNQKRLYPNDHRKALENTWILIKEIFQLQTDGYISVLFAYAFKYKNENIRDRNARNQVKSWKREKPDEFFSAKNKGIGKKLYSDKVQSGFHEQARERDAYSEQAKADAYKNALSEICSLWQSTDTDFQAKCSELNKNQPHLKDRRHQQQDHIDTIIELFQFPALQVGEKDCRDDGTRGFTLAAIGEHSNKFWGYVTRYGQLTETNKAKITRIYSLPDDCGGQCHPIDVSVGGRTNEDFRVATVTEEEYVLLYRIGKHYQLHLVCKKRIQSLASTGNLKSVVVCGNLFGYMTLYGKIELFHCNDLNNPVLVKTWTLFNSFEHFRLRCSNDGMKLLVESQLNPDYESAPVEYFWGFAAIEIDPTEEDYNPDLAQTYAVKRQAEIVGEHKDLKTWEDQDNKRRLQMMRGLALDSNENFFIASMRYFGLASGPDYSISGVYQRKSDATYRVIREYPESEEPNFSDVAVDEDGFVYVEQLENDDSGGIKSCVYKYQFQVDFENIDVP